MRRQASPFLKWAGGKTQLLPQLDPFFPGAIPRYVEPFAGSGAVFFHLRARGALTGSVLLADSNAEIVNAYEAVRDAVEDLIGRLAAHRAAHGREYYYSVRAEPFSRDVAGAARTLYLNKTCFNGLYRVNRGGQFNVPMGRYKNPRIFDAEGLRAASLALQDVELVCQDFRATLDACPAGDLLYVDPPYVPLSATASFTAYVPGGFGPAEQEVLAAAVREADARGARFVLSNSYTPEVCRLYDGFKIERVAARRAINSVASRRGVVQEVAVRNFG